MRTKRDSTFLLRLSKISQTENSRGSFSENAAAQWTNQRGQPNAKQMEVTWIFINKKEKKKKPRTWKAYDNAGTKTTANERKFYTEVHRLILNRENKNKKLIKLN